MARSGASRHGRPRRVIVALHGASVWWVPSMKNTNGSSRCLVARAGEVGRLDVDGDVVQEAAARAEHDPERAGALAGRPGATCGGPSAAIASSSSSSASTDWTSSWCSAAPFDDHAHVRQTIGMEHVDVLIVGAGLSGIGAAHHLQDRLPGKTYAIFEAREAIGGTWDLFRYPGVRSDSDMQTLGYRFRPWNSAKAIADGPSILSYVLDTAREAGIDQQVRYGHRVQRAEWAGTTLDGLRRRLRADHAATSSTCAAATTATTRATGRSSRTRTAFAGQIDPPAVLAAGPRLRGQADRGDRQRRDRGDARARADRQGRARDDAPALADATSSRSRRRTRSPTCCGELLGDRRSYAITRWKNVAVATLIYQLSQRRPRFMRKVLRAGVARSLPDGYDVDTHFNPRYGPWDQRLCLVPDGDLFKAIQRGPRLDGHGHDRALHAATGIKLTSGAELAGGHHRHRHRAEPARARRHRTGRRRRAGRACPSAWPTRA